MIEVNHLTISFGSHSAVRDVSLSIPNGALCAFAGPSACGKSTLLRALRGGLDPSAGSVKIEGLNLQRWPAKALAQRFSYLCQSADLNLNLNVAEVASLHPSVESRHCARDAPSPSVRKALEILGVAHLANRLYGTLSHSEQRRVQIARVLARSLQHGEAQARYLLLDEPQSGLSARQWRHLLHALTHLVSSGLTIVAAIGDPRFARTFPGDIIRLRDGAIAAPAPITIENEPKGAIS